jgi:MFS family permease
MVDPRGRSGLLWLFEDRNRRSILAFELLWGLAMPFAYASTVLPGFLRSLDVSTGWIGLVPAIHSGVVALVQPVSAHRFRPQKRRLRAVRLVYSGGSVGYILLGLMVLGGMRSPMVCLVSTVLATLLFAVTTGVADPQYMELVVHAVEPEWRGRFFALRTVLLGIGGILGGAGAELILRLLPSPANFGASIFGAGMLYAGSTMSLLFYRERVAPPPPIREPFLAYARRSLVPLIMDPRFGAFLAAGSCFGLAVAGYSFLAMVVRDRLQESDRIFGTLGAVMMAANLLTSGVVGWVCDRFGSRTAAVLTLVSVAAGILGCIYLSAKPTLMLAYFLAATWQAGMFIAFTALGLDLAARSGRSSASPAEVTALMMATMAPARMIGPVAIGGALEQFPPQGVLPIAAGFAAVAAVILTVYRAGARENGRQL